MLVMMMAFSQICANFKLPISHLQQCDDVGGDVDDDADVEGDGDIDVDVGDDDDDDVMDEVGVECHVDDS